MTDNILLKETPASSSSDKSLTNIKRSRFLSLKPGFLRLSVITVLYFGIAVIWSWPLALNLNSAIAGPPWVDPLQHIWNMWWVRFSLFDLHTNPFHTTYLYYPQGADLYLHSLNLTTNLISVPFQMLFGLIPAFNLLMLLSVALTGLATYLLASELIGPGISAWVSGALMTFAPAHFHFVDGQTEWANVEWIIFWCWILIKLQKERQFNLRLVLAGVVFATLTAYVVQYYIIWMVIISVMALIWQAFYRRDYLKAFCRNGLAVWLGMLILYSPLLIGMYYQVRQNRNYGRIDLTYDKISQLDVLSLLTNGYNNTGFDDLFNVDPTLVRWDFYFVSYTLLALALLGTGVYLFAKSRSKRNGQPKPPALGFWMLCGLLFWVLALGPVLYVAGHDTGIPLPSILLVDLPVAGTFLHNLSRFSLITLLALALVAGYAFEQVRHFLRRRSLKAFFALTIALVFIFESWPFPYVLTPIEIPQTYASPAVQNAPGSVVEFPMRGRTPLDAYQMLMATTHNRPIPRGYISKALILPYNEDESPLRIFQQYQAGPDIFSPGLQNGGALALLRDEGVGTVVLDLEDLGDRAGQAQDFMQTITGAPAFAREKQLAFYNIPSGEGLARPVVLPGSNWQPLEKMASAVNARWIGTEATFGILLPQNPANTKASLSLQMVAFAKERHLKVVVNGQEVSTLTLSQELQTYRIPELSLEPGYNRVELIPLESPDSPEALGMGKDTRKLSVQVLNITASFKPQ
ncbi:MAG TPA: hypothetical protein VH186_19240 [Chloroflexia bacterium]|nr:hypothetical protein [Chloroflexia bacterium]